MNLEQQLRPHRKSLVLQAERTIREATGKTPEKSQFNQLISICGEATCAEEIDNYLRYQASRQGKAPWTKEFADATIRGIASVLQDIARTPHEALDLLKVAAWRLYAVYLMRTLTYVKEQQKGNGNDRARR